MSYKIIQVGIVAISNIQTQTMTRLDISFTVSDFSQFMADLKPIHWMALKQILCYHSGAQSMGINSQ